MHTNIELHSKVESGILKVVPIQKRGNPIKYVFEYMFTINNKLIHSLALVHLLFYRLAKSRGDQLESACRRLAGMPTWAHTCGTPPHAHYIADGSDDDTPREGRVGKSSTEVIRLRSC